MDDKVEADTSLSFLEGCLACQTAGCSAAERQRERVPDVVVPGFLNYRVEIPRKIEEIFKEVEKVAFIYSITEEEDIVLKKVGTDEETLRIGIGFYETFRPEDVGGGGLVFVFGRKKYEREWRKKAKKAYKEALEGSSQFEGGRECEEKRQEILEAQVQKEWNVVYLETGEELHRRLRSIAEIYNRNKPVLPRVATHMEDGRLGHMRQVLEWIPGISCSAARCIAEKYLSFAALRNAIASRREELLGLVVTEPDGSHPRRLSERAVNKLYTALFSISPDERI